MVFERDPPDSSQIGQLSDSSHKCFSQLVPCINMSFLIDSQFVPSRFVPNRLSIKFTILEQLCFYIIEFYLTKKNSCTECAERQCSWTFSIATSPLL